MGRPADDKGMSTLVFVCFQPKHRKFVTPEGRSILEYPWTDGFEHARRNPDIGDHDIAANFAAWHQKMARLLAEERHCYPRPHADVTERPSRITRKPAWNVHGDDRRAAFIQRFG